MANVPTHVGDLQRDLALDLAPDALETLEGVCEDPTTLARRLRRAVGSPHLGDVTADGLRDKLEKHGLPRDRFDGPDDGLTLRSNEDVLVFLDVIEQLYYEADFTGEHRRADRYSQLSTN